jgi:hypothetical protein
MAKKTKKKDAKAKTVKTPLVYIGRPIAGLPTFTVFKDGVIPSYVQEMAKKDEAIKGLIVPVAQLQEARKNMFVSGHILNYYYKQQKNEK